MQRVLRSWLAVVGAVGCLVPVLAGTGPQASRPLSDAAKEEFLLRARIVSRQTLWVGVTESERATLSDGRLTHDAHIQTIDSFHKRFRTAKRM